MCRWTFSVRLRGPFTQRDASTRLATAAKFRTRANSRGCVSLALLRMVGQIVGRLRFLPPKCDVSASNRSPMNICALRFRASHVRRYRRKKWAFHRQQPAPRSLEKSAVCSCPDNDMSLEGNGYRSNGRASSSCSAHEWRRTHTGAVQKRWRSVTAHITALSSICFIGPLCGVVRERACGPCSENDRIIGTLSCPPLAHGVVSGRTP